MINIFHRSREFVEKHKQHHHLFLAVLALAVAGTGAYTYRHEIAHAATYTFSQSSWVGGGTGNTATHASNQSGWTEYTSASSSLTVGSTIALTPASYSFTDDGTASTTSLIATGGGFANGTNSSTAVSGSGSGASVGLGYQTPDSGTGANGAYSCTTGTCSLTGGTYNYTTFNISSGATVNVTGSSALVIKATGNITIDGTLNASPAVGGAAVAGGFCGGATYLSSACGNGAGEKAIRNGSTSKGVGAGGGTYGGLGGDSLQAFNTNGHAGPYSDIDSESFGGGGGGYTYGAGGASGGNIKIYSAGTIAVSGGISANGAAGQGLQSGTGTGAGGGGSGGRVYLFSNVVNNTGTIAANGGAGGGLPSYGGGGGGGAGRIYLYGNTVTTGTISLLGGAGGIGTNTGNPGSGNTVITGVAPYALSGNFSSNVIDLGGYVSNPTLSWASSTPSGTSVTMEVRTSADNSTWTAYSSIANDGSITVPAEGVRYIQYRATLNGGANTPTLDSVTINYTQYPSSASLVSSSYDTVDPTNILAGVSWVASGVTANETVALQVRTSADNSTWTSWCGATACNDTDTFTTSPGTIGVSHPLRTDGIDDRYVQYRAILSSGGAETATVSNVTLTYVVNARPAVANVSPAQVSDSASANYGKVSFSFDASDPDTTTGSTGNAGHVTPTLYEYSTNGGSSWTTIASGMSANAYDPVVLTADSATTTTSVTWTPPSGIALTANAQIRVTVSDNEAANATAVATSANFTLDSTAPTISAANLDSSATQDVVNVTASDSSTLEYRLGNTAFASATSTEFAWTTISSGVATPINWDATGSPSAETVYIQVRDLYGNTTSRTVIAPATPSNFITTDTTNLNADVYREFLSWGVATSSNFGSYKVYSNTTGVGSAYSLIGTVTDSATNYYTDTITTATSSTHYYKMVTVSSNGDISNFSTIKSDVPDGSGSTDVTPPYIPIAGIAVASVGNTTANITFSTYTDVSLAEGELATSTVYYGTYSGSVPLGCPASTSASNTFVVNHSTYLTGLTPSSDYYFCVTARDMSGNVSAASPSVGGTFTTVGGAIITNVTEREITDNSAVIFWNTDTSSDSSVYYATTQSGVDSATPVTGGTVTTPGTDGTYQHQVGLTGLTTGATYYFKIVSTDTGSPAITSTDDNSDQYYSFVTLKDTTPPTITGTSTPVIAPEAAVIVWTTDEPATSQIQWGLDSNYGTSTPNHSVPPSGTELSIYHVLALSATSLDSNSNAQTLVPETTYHYHIITDDAAGNRTISDDATFTTPSTGDVTITYVNVVSSSGDTTQDTTNPTISDVTVTDITPFGATVTFGTSEDTVGFVKYGKELPYSDIAGDDTWGTKHTIKFHGLTLGTAYHVMVSAVDKSGNTGTSADQTFTTKFLSEGLGAATVDNIEQYQKEIEAAIESVLPSLVPPFVSKPVITDTTESSATVSFKTNIASFPVVVYADQGSYDSTKDNPYTGEVSDTSEKATSHEFALTGLKGNTTYHLQARAFSLPKVIGKSTDITFTTKASKIVGTIVEHKKDSFTVAWGTDTPTTSIVDYKNGRTGVTERKTDDALRTSHSIQVTNLPPGTAYTVSISGMTEGGNLAEAGSTLSVSTSVDVTPPTITGFKVDNALVPGRTDRIQTIVSWTTDEPGNSTVYYEEGAGTAGETKELANKNEDLNSYVLNHSVILPSLKPGTIYRLKVTSSDDSGNTGSFGPRTVITPQQTASITDIIFKNFEDSFQFLKKI